MFCFNKTEIKPVRLNHIVILIIGMQTQLGVNHKQKKQEFKIIKIQDNELKAGKKSLFKVDKYRLWNEYKSKDFFAYEQTCQSSLEAQFQNGFFSAFLFAYNKHGNVKITPDDVWLTIMLYFSDYVNNNAEQLRKAFVTHEGKKTLVVCTQNQWLQTQWNEFFEIVIDQIKQNTTKDVTQKFQCNFSTTGRIETTLSTAIIMNTYKQYFEYERYITDCGIHEVHFGGLLQDWQKIYKKTQDLKVYDVNGELNTYIAHLLPILKQFIETYKGNVDVQFWNRVIRQQGIFKGSGVQTVFTGWLINFFGQYEKAENIISPTIDVEIKIVNKITGINKTVQLVGGITAVNQSEAKGRCTYRPHTSMAILWNRKID